MPRTVTLMKLVPIIKSCTYARHQTFWLSSTPTSQLSAVSCPVFIFQILFLSSSFYRLHKSSYEVLHWYTDILYYKYYVLHYGDKLLKSSLWNVIELFLHAHKRESKWASAGFNKVMSGVNRRILYHNHSVKPEFVK